MAGESGAPALAKKVETIPKSFQAIGRIAVLGKGCKAPDGYRDSIPDAEKGQLKIAAWLNGTNPALLKALQSRLCSNISETLKAAEGAGGKGYGAGQPASGA